MLSRLERTAYLATALVVVAAILWPLVRNVLDRAPPRPAMPRLALAGVVAVSRRVPH